MAYLVIAVLFGLCAVTAFGYGVSTFVTRASFNWFCDRTVGEVVAIRPVGKTFSATRTESGMTYEPIVTFPDRRGRQVRFQSPVSYSPPRHRAGQEVDVLFMPRNPQRACLAGDQGSLAGPAGWALLGVFFAGVMAVALIVS